MNDSNTKVIDTLGTLAMTSQILIDHLSNSDEDKSHEAISVLLMQGLDLLGPESAAMQQFFPVFDAIKQRIDSADLQGALVQARLFQKQLDEIILLIRNG